MASVFQIATVTGTSHLWLLDSNLFWYMTEVVLQIILVITLLWQPSHLTKALNLHFSLTRRVTFDILGSRWLWKNQEAEESHQIQIAALLSTSCVMLAKTYLFCIHFLILQEGMATCSSIFAWRFPWTKESAEL